MSETHEVIFATWEQINDIADEMTSLYPQGMFYPTNCGRFYNAPGWACALDLDTTVGRVPAMYTVQVTALYEGCAHVRRERRGA